MNSHRENNSDTNSNSAGSNHCFVYIFVLTFSTFTFVASMILTVYLTHIDSLDKALVVLIVASCLLFISGFLGNTYSVYHCKPNSTLSENGENSNRSSQITAASAPRTSTNQRPPDIVRVSRAREFRRKTPPPPYEVQMSEMSRRLSPGSFRITGSSTREAEIAEEARKLIQRLYEEITKTDPLAHQSSLETQAVQQVVDMTTNQSTHQDMTSPKLLRQNLVVQRQQSIAKSSPTRASFGTNQVTRSSLPTQLDKGRYVIGDEGCSAVPSRLSPRLPGRSPVNLRTNPSMKQKPIPNSHPSQPDLQKIIIDSDGRAVVSPQLTPRGDLLKTAYKRKLTSPSQQLQTRLKPKENVTHMAAVAGNTQNNVYEEIEDVRRMQSPSSSRAGNNPVDYYSTESEFDYSLEQTSSDASTVFEPSPAEQQMFFTPNVQKQRQISMLSSRKFRHLGQSPETVLDAIASCFDLTPDEWMAAWNLSRKGVPPDERARILGVRLQEDT